ncbi:MAG: MmcQ/YjbR family DNA-binding protein [Pseudomonadota bacterium]
MDGDGAKGYCLSLPEAWCDFPFGPDVYVFKVRQKMFGTLGWEQDLARINLKCDPHEAQILRDMFEAVLPGYHMNKTHWNTVLLDNSVPTNEIQRMIDVSYTLVVKKLLRAERQQLEITHGREAIYRT